MTNDAAPEPARPEVLPLEGDLDARTAAGLLGGLFTGAAHEDPAGATGCVLDLKRVRFVDSSGLGELLAAAQRARERRQVLLLRNPPSQLQRLMMITGTYGQFRWG